MCGWTYTPSLTPVTHPKADPPRKPTTPRDSYEVADDLGIHIDTLRTWLKRARDEGVKMADAEESDDDAEIRRLRAELKQRDDDLYWKDQEIEFLKKAAGFFAAEQRPKRGSK